MRTAAIASAYTAAAAVAGFYLGASIHGPSPSALIPALAGAAAGFGVGCGWCHLLERRRAAQVTPAEGHRPDGLSERGLV